MADEKISSLMERVYMFLEDSEWQKADEYCERVLDIEPKNAQAYLGKLLAERMVTSLDALKNCQKPLEESKSYNKILYYGDEQLVADIKVANEETKRLSEIKSRNTAKLIKKSVIIGVPAVAVIVVLAIILHSFVFPSIENKQQYEKAQEYAEKGNYQKAILILESIDDYKDAEDLIKEYRYKFASRYVVSAGDYHTAALKADGTVAIAGDTRGYGFNDFTFDTADFNDIVSVSAGSRHTVGLKSDGTVVADFHDSVDCSGQQNVNEWKDIIAISAGKEHTVGLKADGTVVATEYWQSNYCGQCEVDDWEDIIAVSAGYCQTLGLKADGTVVTTKYVKEHNFADGGADCGQFDVGDWKDIVAISAGDRHAVGLKSDGTVVAVGDNRAGQCNVEYWYDIVAISAGEDHTVGLKADGTVVATGYTGNFTFYYGQSDVQTWYDIVAVSASRDHTVGLKADGTVVTTFKDGDTYGQHSIDSLENIKLPSTAKND